jgi:FeS assembly SUF system regulator
MLRISKLADYGTIIMVYLATRVEHLSNTRDIAQHTHLSLPTVSKLLKRLTSAGLLISVRGAAGGYRLQRLASDMSLMDILYALDEPRGLTECQLHPNTCALQDVCHVQGNWRVISQVIESTLNRVSLAVLANPSLAAVDVDRMKQQVSQEVANG